MSQIGRRAFLAGAGFAPGLAYTAKGANTQAGPTVLGEYDEGQFPLVWSTDPINIDRGRQLFIDEFLVDATTLTRTFHRPELYHGNPILKPETPIELDAGINPCVCCEDGVFYDPHDRLFKMWYEAGWWGGSAYAISDDGFEWRRPQLDVVPGTNLVLRNRQGYRRDGGAVWLDRDAKDEKSRVKLTMFFRVKSRNWSGSEAYTSPDGIHWSEPSETGPGGDNIALFYNPFKKMWCFSLRTHLPGFVRVRSLRAHPDFATCTKWTGDDLTYWANADQYDPPDPIIGDDAQLYQVLATPYESLMLGIFMIHRGPHNDVCAKTGMPKLTDLTLAYSRDGFRWHRPDRRAFMASSRLPGAWDYGYMHGANGCCLVAEDRLYFYYTAFSGISPRHGHGMYAGGSVGVATLRRDGFCSMDAGFDPGTLTTHLITFRGSHLFVNANAKDGELRAEMLDEKNNVIEPFTLDQSVRFTGDRTRHHVEWKSRSDIAALTGTNVRIRFHLRNAQLYSFWVTGDTGGASNGYVAAGGPGFPGSVDAA